MTMSLDLWVPPGKFSDVNLKATYRPTGVLSAARVIVTGNCRESIFVT